MTQILIEISTWLHSLATAIFIGHYLLLVVVYLPALQTQAQPQAGATLSAISKRSRNWLYAALIVFAITGAYLTLVDPNYLGLANFNNAWTIVMLLKHLVVLVMLALGFWFNAVLRVGPMASSPTSAEQAFARFRSHANVMAALGALVLLMTAVSAAQ